MRTLMVTRRARVLVKPSSTPQKSDKLKLGLKGLKGHVFHPTLISFPSLFKGNVQTILTSLKESVVERRQGELKYDRREPYILQDGGKVFIEYMVTDLDFDAQRSGAANSKEKGEVMVGEESRRLSSGASNSGSEPK
eukprot:CAMPEP_0168622566 /NCGR_PEP_ID=MMETSP0449_2-20121227/8340_1 /TAXON_ID=1082188 /ORGANISM="Strombidium rassoulzadegani, Strain ras09" /LENGTH=136 /DNA_ID=CAMNT_0008663849 /DNA_START=6 /DNA_END=415 /DNA_ORIENTATION=-